MKNIFDNYQCDGQLTIFDIIKTDQKQWERFRDNYCNKQGGWMRFDSNNRKTNDDSFDVVAGCCFTPNNIKEPWDNWQPCRYELCPFLKGEE